MRQAWTAMLAGVCAAGLTACGAGTAGPGSPANPGGTTPTSRTSAAGFWTGTTGDNRQLALVVLDTGQYWGLYSHQNASPGSGVGGAIEGTTTQDAKAGTYLSPDGMDYNAEGAGVLAFTVAGTYSPMSALAGTLNYANSASNTFTTTYNADYDSTPSLAAVAGTYSGQVTTAAGQENATVSISSSGAITATGQTTGCQVTGTLKPHATGNIFDTTLTEGMTSCPSPGLTTNGVTYFDKDLNALISESLDAGRTSGILFIGPKQ